MTVDDWVRAINSLAREIEEKSYALHQAVWPQQLADLHDRYRKMAGRKDIKNGCQKNKGHQEDCI